jgi:hypothetical protein
MFKKLLSFFKTKDSNIQQSKPEASKQKSKVTSTRIGELGEHKINIQLDQLPKSCKYISDIMILNAKSRSGYSQIDHVIISPYGLFVIETKNYSGEIKGERKDKQWTVNKRFKLYNPLFQNYGHIKALENILHGYKKLKFLSMISFTMRCRFSIDPNLRKIHSDELIVYDVELSEFIQRKLLRLETENTEPLLTEKDINSIYEMINNANITNLAIREEHINRAKAKNS